MRFLFCGSATRKLFVLAVCLVVIGTILSGCVPPPAADAGAPQTPGSFFFNTLTFLAMIYLGYFILVVYPKNQGEKAQKAFLETLKTGDEVLTEAGIYARFVSLQDEIATVEVDRGTKLRVRASSLVNRPDSANTPKKSPS